MKVKTDLDSSFHCFKSRQCTDFLDYIERKDVKTDVFQKKFNN